MKNKKFSYILELTRRCPNDCLYCYNVWKAQADYPSGELSGAEWCRIIDRLLKWKKPRIIGLSGGEPMLHPDFFQILDYLKYRRLPVTLITNGRFLNEKNISRCLSADINTFELPLLGTNADTHDCLTRCAGSWKKSLAAIQLIKQQSGKVTVVIVLTKKNLSEIINTIKLAISLEADGIMLNNFNVGGTGIEYKEQLLLNKHELAGILKEADGLAEEYEFNITCGVPIPRCVIDTEQFPFLQFGNCQLGGEYPYVAVDPVGHIRPCNHSKMILGNVLEANIEKILAGGKYEEYCQIKPQICETCRLFKNCRGGCKAAAEVCYDNIKKPNPFIEQNLVKK